MQVEVRSSYLESRQDITCGYQSKENLERLLKQLNFIYLPGRKIRLGTPNPLPCRFEGFRRNETPVFETEVSSFWISKFTVTNSEFECFNPKRLRPPTSAEDKQPATNITYLDALTYARWLSRKYQLPLSLPTESEWISAAAPYGWEYPYHREKASSASKALNFVLSQGEYQTIAVDDVRYGTNKYGLYHMGGNIQEFTLGSYYTQGHFGYGTDGRYCILKGGDFGHCPLSSGVNRRAIQDVAMRSERVGMRLVCMDIKLSHE